MNWKKLELLEKLTHKIREFKKLKEVKIKAIFFSLLTWTSATKNNNTKIPINGIIVISNNGLKLIKKKEFKVCIIKKIYLMDMSSDRVERSTLRLSNYNRKFLINVDKKLYETISCHTACNFFIKLFNFITKLLFNRKNLFLLY